MTKHPALVGIVPRKNLWPKIQKERWYHIPVESASKNTLAAILRFFGKEINHNLRDCFKIIERTISNLGGLTQTVPISPNQF